MIKSTTLVIALVLAVGASCKKDEAKSGNTTQPTPPATKPADPPKPADPVPTTPPPVGSTAGSGAPGATVPTGTTPLPNMTLEAVAAPPDGLPQPCTDAHALYVKLHGCASLPEDTRATLIKSWNVAVTSSLAHYKTASDANKKTLENSCATMAKTLPQLLAACK